MVSVDKPADNKAFAEKEGADFPILSDPGKEVAKAYGVLMPNGEYAQRWTFYIGPDGKILDIERHVNPLTAGAGLAAKLKDLGVPKREG
jgi:peroxiredoxin Q/BCP